LPPHPAPAAVLLLLNNRTLAASLLYALQPYYRSVLVAKDAQDALRIIKERATNQRMQRQPSYQPQSQHSADAFATAAAEQLPLCAVILDVGLNGAALNGLDERGMSGLQSGCGGLAVAASIRQMEAEMRAVRVPFLLLRHKRAPATLSLSDRPAPTSTAVVDPAVPQLQPSHVASRRDFTSIGGPRFHDEEDEEDDVAVTPAAPVVAASAAASTPGWGGPLASPSLDMTPPGASPPQNQTPPPAQQLQTHHVKPSTSPRPSSAPSDSHAPHPAAATSSLPRSHQHPPSSLARSTSSVASSSSSDIPVFVDPAVAVSAQLDILWPLLCPCDIAFKPVAPGRIVQQLDALTSAFQRQLLAASSSSASTHDALAATAALPSAASASAPNEISVALTLHQREQPQAQQQQQQQQHRRRPSDNHRIVVPDFATAASSSAHAATPQGGLSSTESNPCLASVAPALSPPQGSMGSLLSSPIIMQSSSTPVLPPVAATVAAGHGAGFGNSSVTLALGARGSSCSRNVAGSPDAASFHATPPATSRPHSPQHPVDPAVGVGSSMSSSSVPRPLHILIVEDQLVNQKLLAKMLGKLGYTYEIASNGALAVGAVQRSFGFAVSPPGIEPVDATTAVSAASASTVTTTAMAASTSSSSSSTPRAAASVGRPFDLLLMDVAMPVMDGVTATRAIRQWCAEHRGAVNEALAASAAAAVPSASVTASAAAPPSSPTTSVPVRPSSLIILGLTAHAMVADEERCIAAGMDFVLHKPCSFKELAAQIDKWTTKTAVVAT
jgi:CheY-like chemotaxis protein